MTPVTGPFMYSYRTSVPFGDTQIACTVILYICTHHAKFLIVVCVCAVGSHSHARAT